MKIKYITKYKLSITEIKYIPRIYNIKGVGLYIFDPVINMVLHSKSVLRWGEIYYYLIAGTLHYKLLSKRKYLDMRINDKGWVRDLVTIKE